MKTLPDDPAVSVEELAGIVSAPFRLTTAAPPDKSRIFVAAADVVKVIPPLAFNVPVVRRIFAILDTVAFGPANVISPATVAVPALMFHVPVKAAVGWLSVTAPFTTSVEAEPCVKEVLAAGALIANDVHVLSLFIVTAAPEAKARTGKSVEDEPPIELLAPLNVTVFAPPLNVPPLLAQFPETLTLPLSVTVTPEFNCTLPNVRPVVGVTVELPVKIDVAPELSVRPPVAETLTLPPMFSVEPETVARIGVAEPPEANA